MRDVLITVNETPNFLYMDMLAGGDEEFKERFLFFFKEEYLWEVGMYLRHIRRKEFAAAAIMVAKTKYKFSMLGLVRAFDFAKSYELRLNTNDAKMHEEYRRVLKKINRFLQEDELQLF